jgi:sugar phosphate isomerase/epimerase/nucleoside-diphosphate-sugar epimerase
MIAIIGYTGLVGSYIHSAFPTADCYNSQNSADMRGRTYDTVYCAGISATKWYANKNPQEDWANILLLLNNLFGVIVTGKCVLISTIDVYNHRVAEKLTEDDEVTDGPEAYGAHRLAVEHMVREHFGSEKCLVVRLCGLFGFGLKKNILYDFINRQMVNPLHLNTKFQWYSLEWLMRDLQYCLTQSDWTTVNLFTEPVDNTDLAKIMANFCPVIVTGAGVRKAYNVQTKLARNGTAYWRSATAVKASILRFLQNMLEGNVLVSNLAGILDREKLLHFGVREIEIAPHKHFGADFITQPLEYFDRFKEDCIYSLQSLHYPQQFNMHTDYDDVLQYTKRVVDIAEYIGARVLVFGSPKLRSGGKEEVAVQFFRELGDHIGNKSIVVCIEPNARVYGCDFLVNSTETRLFLEKVNRPMQIRMVLDVGCMSLEKEDSALVMEANMDWLEHVHFSAPNLTSLVESNDKFSWLRYKLTLLGYKGKITLEMLNVTPEQVHRSVYLALKDPVVTVVGGGWYGCHLTKCLLEHGYNPIIKEQTGIFAATSAHNQNRLHLGFHYPRSWETRQLCKRNFDKFKNIYGEVTTCFENNIYVIATDSMIDANTYEQIMTAEGLQYTLLFDKNPNPATQQPCFLVNEELINYVKAKEMFETKLQRCIRLEKCEHPCLEMDADMVLDCTYNSFGTISDCTSCCTLCLIYRANEGVVPIALTVMDGPFCSLYPLDITKRLYTLTHVKYGVVSEQNVNIQVAQTQFETDIVKFYPSFRDDFKFYDFFVTHKWKLDSGSDSRHLVYSQTGNVISFMSGKITGMFDAQQLILYNGD